MVSVRRKVIKDIVLYVLVFILLIILAYFVFWDDYLKDVFMYMINGNQKQEKSIVTSVNINGVDLPFDKNTNTFYYPVNEYEKRKRARVKY